MLFALAIFFFVMLVIVHEFGHFVAAKRNGVEVDEFGIGFPPKIASKKMGKGFWRTEYSLNLLPLGGFVRLLGETDSDTREGSFGAASLRTKVKIMLAGVFMNLITAFAIFIFLAFVGMPRLIPNQYLPENGATVTRSEVRAGYVEPNSPADKAGVQNNDVLVEFNGTTLTQSDELFDLTEQSAGQEVEVVIVRDQGAEQTLVAQLNDEDSDQPYFGVSPADLQTTRYGLNAPVVGVVTTAQFGWETLKGLGNLFADLVTADFSSAKDNVSGPVGVVVVLQNSADFGILYVLSLIGLISLTLAIMNALPIPALDGGRLAVTLIYRALGKPLTESAEQRIHGTGFAVLLILIFLITIVDIDRFF
jgi:regulator of sigma E protease